MLESIQAVSSEHADHMARVATILAKYKPFAETDVATYTLIQRLLTLCAHELNPDRDAEIDNLVAAFDCLIDFSDWSSCTIYLDEVFKAKPLESVTELLRSSSQHVVEIDGLIKVLEILQNFDQSVSHKTLFNVYVSYRLICGEEIPSHFLGSVTGSLN